MNSSLISARVPVAKREAAQGMLTAIGATTSDLVNSAFDYLLATKHLPQAEDPERCSATAFAQFVEESTFDIPWEDAGACGDYRELICEGKRLRYESLA
ncbi:hypothetical protein [Enterorhabdus sp. P55]|uniref:hypothetical protein n=1 Tax=Enterorhabdus sp. P55 TaxID=2304571 RepID=UPI001367CC7F|nr:hypothetical protein [Enterorhabdus sp. P55]NBI32575.1 hypothetical protein [Enterorhabdus sp. P55]